MVNVPENLMTHNLGIVDGQEGTFIQQMFANKLGWRFTSVACVRFESESKDGNLFVSNGVEQALNDSFCETPLLVVIHDYDLEIKKRMIFLFF